MNINGIQQTQNCISYYTLQLWKKLCKSTGGEIACTKFTRKNMMMLNKEQ